MAKTVKSSYDPSKALSLEGERIDPFYYEQPPLEFIEELKKPYYTARPESFGRRDARADEVSVDGIYVDAADFSEDELIETALSDFKYFSELYGIGGDRYPVLLKKRDTGIFESYEIAVEETATVIYAGDTEGIRRAIYFIEGEITAREGAFLALGTTKRAPVIKERITRGFFSPTNRPPKLGDELLDDVDYYPEGFLDRLAHDGTNGIWIYTSFKQLLRSAHFERNGEECDRRIEKLRGVVKKCARYGVKVYLLAIEPAYLVDVEAESHSYMTGGHVPAGHYAICVSSEAGREYLMTSVEDLFRLVPDLGGYIDITTGERVTSCVSFPDAHRTCPRCSKKSAGALLAETAGIIKEAMRRAGVGAEFISWTYGHKLWANDDIREYVRKCDTDVAIMQNFEEFAYAEQLGEVRQGKDYWLSFPGPGELFKVTGEEARAHGKKLFAKMQVCCSHELASVPYIPTPGLIFEKFGGAYEYGVTGVVECWYFGNYPSVMSRAAGELAFYSDFSDKAAFLKRLAAICYGESRADAVAEAWRHFEEGYRNYPLNIMFSYYGPMHDGVAWELQLKPKDNYLPRAWLLLDKPDGDRIHEALWYGHTLDEAITLAERINESWARGLEALPLPDGDEMRTLSEALGILFSSGERILRFYKLRRDLGMREGDPVHILREMRALVNEEIEASTRMAALGERDKRLGYNSEAEGFKFFPRKLHSRCEQLRALLETEFPEIEERVARGEAPLEFYLGRENGAYPDSTYFIKSGEGEWRNIPESGHRFRLMLDKDHLTVEIDARDTAPVILGFELEPLVPTPTLSFGADGVLSFVSEVYSHQSLFGEKIERELSKYSLTVKKQDLGTTYVLKLDRASADFTKDAPFRLRMKVGGTPLKKTKIGLRLLAKWDEYPDMHIWVIPNDQDCVTRY